MRTEAAGVRVLNILCLKWLLCSIAVVAVACGAAPPPITCGEPGLPACVVSEGTPQTSEQRQQPLLYGMHETKGVDGVLVTAEPHPSWQVWRVQLTNNTEDIVSVNWDSSSMVDAQGRSMGRLLRGETRQIDVGHAQPKMAVAPAATAEDQVFAESLLVAASVIFDRHDPIEPTPPPGLIGARLVLAIEQANGTKTWMGAIEKLDPTTP